MQYSLWFKKEIPADVVIPPFFIANLVHFCCSHFFLVKLPRVFSILLVLTSSFWIYQFFLLFPFCFLRHLFQLLPLLISLHSFICCCCHFYLLRLVLKFWGGGTLLNNKSRGQQPIAREPNWTHSLLLYNVAAKNYLYIIKALSEKKKKQNQLCNRDHMAHQAHQAPAHYRKAFLTPDKSTGCTFPSEHSFQSVHRSIGSVLLSLID